MALLLTLSGCSGTPICYLLPAPSNRTSGVSFFLRMGGPCLASPGAKSAGCRPGLLEWPGQARTHPGLLLFSLELCVDLLGARVLPCPAFVASLSPCTRIGSLGRREGSSFLDCPGPQAVSCLRCSQQRLQTSGTPHQAPPKPVPSCVQRDKKDNTQSPDAVPNRVLDAGSPK